MPRCVVGESVKAQVKSAVFKTLPAMPLAESIESLVRAADLRAVTAREDAEVALAQSLAPPIRAAVVTVIATYRRPDLVRRAVDSALTQRVDDHAVVVVDDGAGDVPDFADSRVRVISLSANIGICGVVRNVGIRCSESSFVAFLDDDNWWAPDHLSRALDGLQSGAVFSYSGIRVVSPSGVVVRETSSPFDRRRLRHTNYVDASSIVAARSPQVRFSRLRRTKGGARHEDWEFAYRVSSSGDVVHVPAFTVNYLDNPDSHYRWTAEDSAAPDETSYPDPSP
jgi:glycosyltransferase involved in cell wall biosynthesis